MDTASIARRLLEDSESEFAAELLHALQRHRNPNGWLSERSPHLGAVPGFNIIHFPNEDQFKECIRALQQDIGGTTIYRN